MIMKRGFTIAEVLISLAVIGVIAAITLPALNTNVVKSQLEVQTRKFYTQFTKALDLYKLDNDTNVLTGMDFDSADFVKKYFNVVRECTKSEDCYAKQYATQINTLFTPRWFVKGNTFELADGAVFTLASYDEDESQALDLDFDVNGKKGPNKVGYDKWSAKVYYNGSVDESKLTPEVKKEKTSAEIDALIQERFYGCLEGGATGEYGGCLGHFMRNGYKFDY